MRVSYGGVVVVVCFFEGLTGRREGADGRAERGET
jgi:hypothetical protein